MKSLAALASALLAQLVLAVVPQASVGSSPSAGPTLPGGSGNTVYGVLKPDLVIHEMTSTNGHAVRVAVKNVGSLRADWSWLRARFASAELGLRYAWHQVPPLQPGFVYDYAFAVEYGVSQGDILQSIEAHADYYNQVDERFETNNTMAVSSARLF